MSWEFAGARSSMMVSLRCSSSVGFFERGDVASKGLLIEVLLSDEVLLLEWRGAVTLPGALVQSGAAGVLMGRIAHLFCVLW